MGKRYAIEATPDVLEIIEKAAAHPVLGLIMSKYYLKVRYLIIPKHRLKTEQAEKFLADGTVVQIDGD